MATRQRKNIFGFGTKKVTYHRDVAKERRELRKQALEDRRDRLAVKKIEAQEQREREREEAKDRAEQRREEMKAKKRQASRAAQLKRAEAAEKSGIKKKGFWTEAGLAVDPKWNPSWGYGIYQGGVFGTEQIAHFKSRAAAETYARSNNLTGYSIKRAFAKNPKRKNSTRNPESGAAALSEAWHGRPAKSATDIIEQVHYHGVLTDLGRLKEITVMVTECKGQKIFFDKHTRLASSENGKQLYVVGGDQSIDLSALGIEGEEAEKDCVVVGEVASIVYVTAKQHLGKADEEVGPYQHELAEDGGVMPVLIYDTMNQTVGFAGGSYFIDPTDYDGSHSAGIRD